MEPTVPATGGPLASGRWWRPPRMRAVDVGERHATPLELFFDLCFVAAVAALASDLHGDPTLAGVLRFAGLFIPVWWAWMGFTWYATAFDTDDVVFRLALLAAMVAVLGLAASVERVGAGDATGFVLAYAAMKLILAGLYDRAWCHARVTRPYCVRYGLSNLIGAAVWLASLLVGVWWIYFSFVSAAALSRQHLGPAFTWGYGQLLIFAGIAAAAVGVEFAIEGVAAHHGVTAVGAGTLGGGLAAFLLATCAVHAATVQGWDAVAGARLGAVAASLGLAVAGPALDPLLLLGLLLAVLVVLTLFEARTAAGGAHRGEVPVERPLLSQSG